MKDSKFVAVDLFAGSGGLGEGFSRAGFDVVCSVEKNRWAAKTLLTRVMFRVLKQLNRISLYWDYVRGNRTLEDILNMYPEIRYKMNSRVLVKTISENSRSGILNWIENGLKNAGATNLTVLLGGPPCQLYSIIGRSRYSSMKDKFYRDPRRKLFEHYIFFLSKLQPCIFVFENVYGITSATLKKKKLMEILFEEFDKC
jgi:DNA (cytosine-5)-methyltransferase 1